MINKISTVKGSTLIGREYPFFLDNFKLGSNHILYKLVSPGLNENYIPNLSFQKISEKLRRDIEFFSELSLLDVCAYWKNNRPSDFSANEYLKNLVKKENPTITDGKDFPNFEMQSTNNLQKSIIIQLRDALRWRTYRFIPGRQVDVLISPTKFAIFDIKGDAEQIWLEPVAVYKNSDVNMMNPLKDSIKYEKTIFSGKGKASELNRSIRLMEWQSFSR